MYLFDLNKVFNQPNFKLILDGYATTFNLLGAGPNVYAQGSFISNDSLAFDHDQAQLKNDIDAVMLDAGMIR